MARRMWITTRDGRTKRWTHRRRQDWLGILIRKDQRWLRWNATTHCPDCQYRKEVLDEEDGLRWTWRSRCAECWRRDRDYDEVMKFRWYTGKAPKAYRKILGGRRRAQIKDRMRQEDYEHLPRFRNDAGWRYW